MHKIGHSGGLLGRLLGPFIKTGLPLMKNVLKPLAKSILIPLGLTAAAATDLATHKKMFPSGMAALKPPMKKWMISWKIIKFLEESGLLVKGLSKRTKNEAKEQKGGFLSMLLGALGASILGNLLTCKSTIRVGEGIIRARQDFKSRLILILKYKNIIDMYLNLMVFNHEIIYVKSRMEHM